MKFLRHVNILGLMVPVFTDEIIKEGYSGLWEPDKNRILLDSKLPPEKMKQVLLHEMLHASMTRTHIWAVISNDLQEVLVDTLATTIAENFKFKIKG